MATRDYARPQRPASPAPRGKSVPHKNGKAKSAARSHQRSSLPLWTWMVVGLSLIIAATAIYYITRPTRPMDMAPSSNDDVKGKGIEIPPKEPSRFAFYEMLPSYEVVVPDDVINPPKPKAGSAANNLPSSPADKPAPRPDLPADLQPADVSAAKPATTPATTLAELKPQAAKPTSAAREDATARLAEELARETPPQPTAQLAKGERFLIQVAAYRGKPDAEQRVAALALAGLSARVEQVTIDNKDTWYRVRLGPYNSATAAAAAQQSLKTQGFSGVVMKVKS